MLRPSAPPKASPSAADEFRGALGADGAQRVGRRERREGGEGLDAHAVGLSVELLTLPEDKRKDLAARQEAINAADAVILCLPDAAAIEAVRLVENERTVVIDASTAHRTDPEWVYGLPELNPAQRSAIETSRRIANPGCYPTGFISLTRPLVDAGLLRRDAALTVSAVSGYSGGGKALMEVYEGSADHEPWGAYGFNLEHKHLPEMAMYSRLVNAPVFLPAVGSFAQGMVVSVPLHYKRDLMRGLLRRRPRQRPRRLAHQRARRLPRLHTHRHPRRRRTVRRRARPPLPSGPTERTLVVPLSRHIALSPPLARPPLPSRPPSSAWLLTYQRRRRRLSVRTPTRSPE